jgi:hypothetical protein
MNLKHKVNLVCSKVSSQVIPKATAAAKAVVAKVAPVASSTAERVFSKVDRLAHDALQKEVELLNKYPNVAMLLSQGTVMKMAAAKGFERSARADAQTVITTNM